MLKAQQNQLAQAANNDLVAIRTNEINYYVQFFTNFGTQCALIAGFQLSSISQVPTWDSSNDIGYTYLYWVSTCVCICLSVHVLLCTVYATVFGQGLALRGPAGSMVRAVDGMMQEQKQILVTFTFNIFVLGVSTVATYYVVMNLIGAHICTVITIVAMFFWHRYCLRIYNRFKWVESPTNWVEGEPHEAEDVDFEKYAAQKYTGTSAINYNDAPAMQSNVVRGYREHSNEGGSKRTTSKHRKKSAFFPKFFGRGGKERSNSRASRDSKDETEKTSRHQSFASNHGHHQKKHYEKHSDATFSRAHSYNPGHDPGNSNYAVRSGAGYGMSNVTHQGYITVVEPGVFSDSMKRRYMLLIENKLLWYETKRDYEINPEKAVNARPVYVDNYIISSMKLPGHMFGITLTPDARAMDGKRVFNFRCDTIDELTGWTNAFKTIMRAKSTSQHIKSNLLLGASDLSPVTGGGGGGGGGAASGWRDGDASPGVGGGARNTSGPPGPDSDDDDAATTASRRRPLGVFSSHRYSGGNGGESASPAANARGEESASLLPRTPSNSSFNGGHGNSTRPYV